MSRPSSARTVSSFVTRPRSERAAARPVDVHAEVLERVAQGADQGRVRSVSDALLVMFGQFPRHF